MALPTPDEAHRDLDRIIGFISNSDNKASILFGFNGIFLTILFSTDVIGKIALVLPRGEDIPIYKYIIFTIYCIILSASFFAWIYGIYRLARVLLPKIDCSDYDDGALQLKSNIFFGGIAAKHFIQYKEALSKQDKHTYLHDILSQIYINSKICTQKFKNLRCGFFFSLVGMIAFLFTFALGIVISNN